MKFGKFFKLFRKFGKSVTGAKKFMLKSGKLKKISKAMKASKKLALNKFKKLRLGMVRTMKKIKCKIFRADPVDCVTGEVVVEQQDFSVQGRIPIEWNRYYGTFSEHRGVCGLGWETLADIRLEILDDGKVIFYDGTNAPTYFDYLPNEKPVSELVDGSILQKEEECYTVSTKEDLVYYFYIPKEAVKELLVEYIKDLCGNVVQFVRDKNGLKEIKESTGRRIDVISQNGLIQKMYLVYPYRDPQFLVQYEYDEVGKLITVYDAMKLPYRFFYKDNILIQHKNRNGLSFYYDYDQYNSDGKCIHAWGDGGLYDYRFVYREDEKITEVTDSLGNVSYIKYDERYMIIEDKDPLGGVTYYEYDEAGRTTAVIDPDGHRTQYEYDRWGNLLKLTRPDGNSITTEFDKFSNPIKITDPNGAKWQQEWDFKGLLVNQVSPKGAESKYEYDDFGQLTTFKDPLGAITRLVFDDYGNLTSITDSLGNTTKFAYNLLGDITTRIDPLGKKTRYEYDLKGRLIRVFLPGGSSISCVYDAEDNIVSFKDENGAETRFEYCGIGEIKRRIQPDGEIVEYQYDTEEQLIGITNQRGEHYELKRDALGRIIAEVDYWGQVRKYSYTGAGHLLESVDPLGKSISYKTDPLGQIMEKILPDTWDNEKSQVEKFEYDANGNLIACENSKTRVEWDYDIEENVVEERQGVDCIISNTYDINGNRISRTTKIQKAGQDYERTVNYNYDELGQAKEIEIPGHDPLRFTRNELGQVTHESFGKNLKRYFNYSDEGFLTAQRIVNDEGPIIQQRYIYDSTGNMLQKHDSVYGIDKFIYNPIGRIISHINPEGKLKHYIHDEAGDLMLTKLDSKDNWSREGLYDGTQYKFDRAGNLVNRISKDSETVFIWDSNSRLVESETDGYTSMYCYDPLGRRISKETNGVVTRFYWDEDVLLSDVREENVREWVCYPGSFEPLAMLKSQDVFLYHNDPNGCPTTLLDRNGKVVWAARYNAIGKVDSLLVDEVDNPIRMQGQYFDVESELYYNRYRYFDYGLCAFISQDPLGLFAGENVYEYAPNVWTWVDPLGLKCIANKIAGTAREKKVGRKLEGRFGKKNVLRERYLRDSKGKIVRDSNGKARRVDFVVIGKNGKGTSIEVTSKTADKTAQLLKESEIRQLGGTFVRNPKTKKLIEVNNVSRVIRLE